MVLGWYKSVKLKPTSIDMDLTVINIIKYKIKIKLNKSYFLCKMIIVL